MVRGFITFFHFTKDWYILQGKKEQIAFITSTTDTAPGRRHHGRNIKTIREMLGVKQDALAIDLNVSQQNISSMESREQPEDEVIGKIASALGIKPELIKNFVPEEAI